MRVNLGSVEKIFSEQVFIIATYNEDGTVDAMNCAWGGIGNDKEIFICLDPKHKTCENIKRNKAFTVSMGQENYVVSCDYVGIVSANNEPNKFKKSGFSASKSTLVNAPIINELAICLECKLKTWDEENCHLFGEIVNVSVDESALTDSKVDISKIKPIIYNPFNMSYHTIGEKVGSAFKDGTKLK